MVGGEKVDLSGRRIIYSFISIDSSLYFHNHRRVEVGRHLWSSPGPALPVKQFHLELVVQGHV